uniref:Peptidase S54 rhomboid domain-containing protein n=1 Tax=Pavo cristatus TaxID=9049 RepID=A0A8C9L8R3_PAVCR
MLVECPCRFPMLGHLRTFWVMVFALHFWFPTKVICLSIAHEILFFSHRTSFAGHLAGILVGLMYTMGPLKKIMKACAGGFSSFTDPDRPRNYYSGYSDYYRYPDDQYRAPRNYYDYTGGLTEEEQLERAVQNSLNERGQEGKKKHLGIYFSASANRDEGNMPRGLTVRYWSIVCRIYSCAHKKNFFMAVRNFRQNRKMNGFTNHHH